AVHKARGRSVGHRRLFCAALIAAAALPAGGAQAATAAAASSYHMIAQYPIGGNDTGYDYLRVDAPTRHVFVAHASRVEVAIVDTLDLGGSKLEQIGFDGRGRAFVNDEGQSVVHVFDTHSLKALAKWPLAPCEEPTGMAVDRPHHRVFAACGNEKLAVLDADSGRVVATPAIGKDPDGAVFDPKTERIFTSNK